MNKLIKNKLVAGALIGISLSVFLGLISLIFSNTFSAWHLKLADSLYTRNEPSDEIVLVVIDDKTVQDEPFGLGKFSQWERDNYARVVSNITRGGPKVIAFDIMFSHANKYSPEGDEQFAEAISEAGNVVLPFAANDDSVAYPLKKFSENAELGNVQGTTDDDGVYRHAQLGYEDKGSLALASVEKYLGEYDKNKIPVEDDKMLINYFADSFGYKMISFLDVHDGMVPADVFADKIVLIGIVSFKEAQDKGLTPRSNENPMAGVEIHANIMQTLLDGKFLTNQGKFSQMATILGLAVALGIALNYLRIILSFVAILLAIFAYLGAAHFFYRKGLILNMFYPFLLIILSYISAWIYRYFISDRSKREIKSAFGHYVSKELVEKIAMSPDMVKLGGEKRVITVFFSDIKGSTTLSEQTDIHVWVTQINEYFTVMESIIQKLGGTVDKYEGDAIMGFWNAPVEQADHIFRAHLAALEMRKGLKRLNEKWAKEGKLFLEFRIGINTGESIVGNFGSVNRFDYTAMGDTVNVASRLESSANKTYGTTLMAAGFDGKMTEEQKKNIVMRELDTVLLPGKNESIKLFELVCLAKECSPETTAALATYAKGLAAYRAKDFATAIQAFESLPNDPASRTMLTRCNTLQSGQQIDELDQDMVFSILNK